MPKQELTPWFPADVKPVHVGVYERSANGASQCYWYWNGVHWEVGGWATPEEAAINPRSQSPVSSPWRGLAHNPKE